MRRLYIRNSGCFGGCLGGCFGGWGVLGVFLWLQRAYSSCKYLLFRLAHADVGDALESVCSSSPSMPLVVLTATATHEEV